MTDAQIGGVVIAGIFIAVAGIAWLLLANDDRAEPAIKAAAYGYTADYPEHPDYSHGCVIGVIPGTNVLASVPAPKPSIGTAIMPIPCPYGVSKAIHLGYQ
jgi:hypothetical protein